MHVVVAHTDPCARDELATPLRDCGYDVAEAADYAQALAACQEHQPDVALVSRCIESPAGGTLLDELKAHRSVFSTAVILVAPEEMPSARIQELMGRGAEDLLVEPVTAAEVLARVRSAHRTKTRVNDEYGHDAGDAVLVAITGGLRERLRAEDELGRLGGEEFLALLPDSDERAAAAVAEDLRVAVEAVRARCREHVLGATVSVGWATWDGEESPDELVKRADIALYDAKAAGRNAVRGAENRSASLPRRT